ncbi:hypothetical protein CHLRE_10g458800v5 [Chlamydomonas reinhardtii]|uniref:SRCR domain-containing protein n=1 Tax=Chlamydomonas reinhardtii TaxID=3055 RepID=A8I0W3_CHLRE|nr:uncharacterized protein CHLRE_10g458800v5 [Chlamydomonas reinhardtii]PNW77966.1 hypothetical protein CHLRE_10g458800v5 [Chlamydomonas reinhardtii]|eukprot:XP_001698391.1 predicted protein [Chlamydomonas reinhardtii]
MRGLLFSCLLLAVLLLSAAVVHAQPALTTNRKSPSPKPSPKPSPPKPPSPPSPKPPPKPRPSPKKKSPKPKKSPPPPAFVRAKNGIRLVDGAGPRGRLEVSSTDGWVSGLYDGSVAWRPLCDSGVFDDYTAQTMCEMLDYKYGRKYYTAKVAYPNSYNKSEYASQDPLDYLSCYSNSPDGARRMLHAGSSASHTLNTAGAAAMGEEEGAHRELRGGGHARKLTAPLRGDVNTPPESPYSCAFRLGECTYDGPLVGIECSMTEFPPAPPPPPSPPNPPPAPPPKSGKIRLIGGSYMPGDIEPNLCNAGSDVWPDCQGFGRVEVQVPDAGGNLIWAPLCPAFDGDESFVADVACKQAFDWPDKPKPSFFVSGNPLLPGWTIPTSPVTNAAYFNPAAYTGWASIVGGDVTTALSLQELDLQVTTEPCPTGYMFAVYCQISM